MDILDHPHAPALPAAAEPPPAAPAARPAPLPPRRGAGSRGGGPRRGGGRGGGGTAPRPGLWCAPPPPPDRPSPDPRLYLDQDWAADAARRAKTYVPEDVAFQEKWRIALG